MLSHMFTAFIMAIYVKPYVPEKLVDPSVYIIRIIGDQSMLIYPKNLTETSGTGSERCYKSHHSPFHCQPVLLCFPHPRPPHLLPQPRGRLPPFAFAIQHPFRILENHYLRCCPEGRRALS